MVAAGCEDMIKIADVRKIARQRGLKSGGKTKKELIRSIQRAEGYHDCFATSYVHACNQMNCLSREDCLRESCLKQGSIQ